MNILNHTQNLRIILAALMTTIFSCSSGPRIYKPDKAVISSDQATPKIVGDSILSASRFLEPWTIKRVRPGQMEGVLSYNKHSATVLIEYDAYHFEIIYKNSENFDYDHNDHSIHPNYNGWIKKLENKIKAEIEYRLELLKQ